MKSYFGIVAAIFAVLAWKKSQESGNTGGYNPNVSENLGAFLRTIQFAEGTFKKSDPYRVCYGYSHTIQNLSDHPSITGEWLGKILPDNYCISAGFSPGCKSTAAGAYQIIRPTWNTLKTRLGLTSFDAYNQDRAAIELIREKGAVADIENGDIEKAIYKVAKVWASLPSSPYGQPTKTVGQLIDFYAAQGGGLNRPIA